MLVPHVTCIYSPFVMPEILHPNLPVSRAFLGMSPVPLPPRLPFSPTFLAIYLIWSLHLLRLKSSTSSSFSDLDPVSSQGMLTEGNVNRREAQPCAHKPWPRPQPQKRLPSYPGETLPQGSCSSQSGPIPAPSSQGDDRCGA